MGNHWITLKRAVKLGSGFWTGDAKRVAWGWSLLLVTVLIAINVINLEQSYAQRGILSALQTKSQNDFWHNLQRLGIFLLLALPIVGMFGWVKGRLVLAWRDWRSKKFLREYYDNDYFHAVDASIDNRDQRIQQDTGVFCDKTAVICLALLDNAMAMLAFFGVLWLIDWKLVIVAICYASVGTFIMLKTGKRLVLMFANQERLEAELRRGMIHSADNATSVVSYHGAPHELSTVLRRLSDAVNHWARLLWLQAKLTTFKTGYDIFIMLVPMIMTVPLFFAGKLDLGAVTQAGDSFSRVLGALSMILVQFQQIAELSASITRLGTFDEELKRLRKERDAGHKEGEIRFEECDAGVTVTDLSVRTPDNKRTLVTGLTFRLARGQRLLITGPSGCGKSSILKAVAGLWKNGGGTVARPKGTDTLFLPQKPYMPLGTLREQLVYPREASEVPDQMLLDILRRVNLADMPDKFGGLDAVQNWAEVLSGGEQQRVAIGRMLLAKPKLVILDEATSALDAENERLVYQAITACGITVVSVAHRPSLLQFHDNVLKLDPVGGWRLSAASDYHAAL